MEKREIYQRLIQGYLNIPGQGQPPDMHISPGRQWGQVMIIQDIHIIIGDWFA